MPKIAKDTPGSGSKPAGKTRISQSQAQKYLAQVPAENAFWCNNGTVIKDLKELKDALAGMSDQTFYYHSNAIKKDFSNWIKYVIGDEQLAEDLQNANNRQKATQIVEDRYNLMVARAA